MYRLLPLWVLLSVTSASYGEEPTQVDLEFFEKKIRPVLVDHCYKCHSAESKSPKGGLRVDSREALLEGGESGPALVPGQAEKSKFWEAVRYTNPDLQMPPRGKLDEAVLADLRTWLDKGAIWPKSPKPTTQNKTEQGITKTDHWSWKPIQAPSIPKVKQVNWPQDPVDAFILAKLESKHLQPAAKADQRTLMRRIYFDLIGLPPKAEEIEAFLKDDSPQAFAKVVDRLLQSPHFGERWGRHWLDLVRYAESRGHEIDATIPNAYQYRDYVIRALNTDVPYNQFVVEHIAGDLLPKPRTDPEQKLNESILGTGFWFLGEEVHSPVDIRGDEAERFDNRMDVMCKTFLGLTVSCARCHDHKFDAISTKDYYALMGFLRSSNYRQVRFDSMLPNREVANQLQKLRSTYSSRMQKQIRDDLEIQLQTMTPDQTKLIQDKLKGLSIATTKLDPETIVFDFGQAKSTEWFPDDVSYGNKPIAVGELLMAPDDGKKPITWAEIGQARFDPFWKNLRTTPNTELEVGSLAYIRAGRSIRTPTFGLATGKLFVQVRGQGKVYASIDSHTLITGPLHGRLVTNFNTNGAWKWIPLDLTPYTNHRLHLEFTALDSADLQIAKVIQSNKVPEEENKPLDLSNLSLLWKQVIQALQEGSISTETARILNTMLEHPDQIPAFAINRLQPILQEYRQAEAQLHAHVVWNSRTAMAMQDGSGEEEHVFIRGSHKALGEKVPRRFLSTLSGSEGLPISHGSGRLQLAQVLVNPKQNPFITRVFVNRVWHHLFGKGIVASVDNFGVMGDLPTHPELLDYLANRFEQEGWSMKRLIRFLVLSSTYQMASEPTANTKEDPDNQLWHRMRMKRLPGEVIRDSMLAISGRFDAKMYGPSVPIHLTEFMDGRGRPGASGPLDGEGRRSIYIAIRRNFLSPMMLAFDTPIPFSTVGKRTVSNVPAQNLILMNDPFVQQQAHIWAKRVVAKIGSVNERITSMYVDAFSRLPTEREMMLCTEFLTKQANQLNTHANDPKVWADLAHMLFNVKEFIYLP